MNIHYLSRRGKRVMHRSGEIIVDQFPGDERRLVIRRDVTDKKLMINLKEEKLCQQRDEESKWTRIGKLVGVDDAFIEDDCPECGPVTGELKYRGATLQLSMSSKPYRSHPGKWQFICPCGEISEPTLVPDEPPFPEPENYSDYAGILQLVQEYAEVANHEIFGNEIDLNKVSWTWNTRNSSTAGRAYGGYKIELTPQYLQCHSWNEFLKVVRHELIHIWEAQCGEDSAGHSAQFHQWLVPANTRRNCRAFR